MIDGFRPTVDSNSTLNCLQKYQTLPVPKDISIVESPELSSYLKEIHMAEEYDNRIINAGFHDALCRISEVPAAARSAKLAGYWESQKLDISMFPAGVYFIELFSGNQYLGATKFIKISH